MPKAVHFTDGKYRFPEIPVPGYTAVHTWDTVRPCRPALQLSLALRPGENRASISVTLIGCHSPARTQCAAQPANFQVRYHRRGRPTACEYNENSAVNSPRAPLLYRLFHKSRCLSTDFCTSERPAIVTSNRIYRCPLEARKFVIARSYYLETLQDEERIDTNVTSVREIALIYRR